MSILCSLTGRLHNIMASVVVRGLPALKDDNRIFHDTLRSSAGPFSMNDYGATFDILFHFNFDGRIESGCILSATTAVTWRQIVIIILIIAGAAEWRF